MRGHYPSRHELGVSSSFSRDLLGPSSLPEMGHFNDLPQTDRGKSAFSKAVFPSACNLPSSQPYPVSSSHFGAMV